MNWTRDHVIRLLLAGLCSVAAQLVPSRAHAQGFGPDPFRPYNSQYTQYAYPIGREIGGPVMPARAVSRGDNQFQQWMTEQEGASRLSTERFGAGVPYWRMRTDYAEEKLERRKRRAAKNTDRLESMTQKYLAYFNEQNPRKRAILLREYTPPVPDDEVENEVPRGAGRLGADARGAGRLGADARGRSGAGGRTGATSSPRGAAGMAEEKSGRRIPPAPSPLRGFGRSTRSRPSDVLNRALDTDDDDPDAEKSPARKRSTRRSADSPATDE